MKASPGKWESNHETCFSLARYSLKHDYICQSHRSAWMGTAFIKYIGIVSDTNADYKRC